MSNETTIIVVIGSVTAKQYKDVRLECLRLFGKPKIVRIHEDMFPGSYGFFDDEEVARRSGISSYEMDASDYGFGDFALDVTTVVDSEIRAQYGGLDTDLVEYVVLSPSMAERFFDRTDEDFGQLQELFSIAQFRVATAS